MNTRTLLLVVAAIATPLPCMAAPQTNAAQAIAQKFSEADAPQTAAPQSKKTAPATPKAAERPSLDYEMDMLRRARAEELEREQSAMTSAPSAVAKSESSPEQPKTSQPTAVPSSSEVSKLSTAPAIEPTHAQENGGSPRVATDPKLAQSGNAEAPEKSVPADATAAAPTVATAKPDDDVKPAALPQSVAEPKAPSASDTSGQRITVLLALATDANAVARPDPILCVRDTCWLSNGLENPAKPMPRSMAMALASTESASADSCHGKSACAYRNVAVPDDGVLEIIQIGSPTPSSGGGFSIVPDSSCRIDQGDFVCDNGLETRDFRIWTVPEAAAKSAGPAALEDAIDNDLEAGNAQSTNDK